MRAKMAVEPHSLFICIDEAQTLDPDFGWADFRPQFGSKVWKWMLCSLDPRFVLLSGSTTNSGLWKTCGTLGIERSALLTFTAPASRDNIFLQRIVVDRIDVSTQDRTLGFLLPIIASGKKVQIFVQSLDVMNMATSWLSERCGELGLRPNLQKVCGNNSPEHREKLMQDFRDSTISVLVSTDVACMGVHSPWLDIGVSLGIASTRWKLVQQCGRLGRDPTHQAIFVGVYETKKIAKAEGEVRRLERDLVRAIYTTEGCMRTGFFSGFSVANPTVHYENPELPLLAGRCKYCWCCSWCAQSCTTCRGSEDEVEQICRVMGIPPEKVESAKNFAEQCGAEEERLFGRQEQEELVEDLVEDLVEEELVEEVDDELEEELEEVPGGYMADTDECDEEL